MELGEIDGVGAKVEEAGFEVRPHVRHDVARRLVGTVGHDVLGGGIDSVAKLRGDDNVAVAVAESGRERPFAVSAAVVRCRVEERHAEIKRLVDRPNGLCFVNRTPPGGVAVKRPDTADCLTPHADGRDLDAALPECSLHADSHRIAASPSIIAPCECCVAEKQAAHACQSSMPWCPDRPPNMGDGRFNMGS